MPYVIENYRERCSLSNSLAGALRLSLSSGPLCSSAPPSARTPSGFFCPIYIVETHPLIFFYADIIETYAIEMLEDKKTHTHTHTHHHQKQSKYSS